MLFDRQIIHIYAILAVNGYPSPFGYKSYYLIPRNGIAAARDSDQQIIHTRNLYTGRRFIGAGLLFSINGYIRNGIRLFPFRILFLNI